MERSLAGVLFLVAAIALSIAAGGWWMQRILFTPDANRSTAAAILAEPDIRAEINSVVSGASAPVVGREATELFAFVETQVLSTRAGAAMMGPIVEEAHERIIGLRDDEPLTITGDQMVEIVRDQRAAEAATVTLPIGPIGVLENMRGLVGWLIPISAGLGVIALVLGILTRPERRDLLRGLAELGFAMAASILLFGYALPVHLLTAIDNATWASAMPRLAMRTLPVVLGSAAVLALAGVALLLASTSGGKRRQWSTPLSVARYQGGENPGWR